MYTNDFLCNKSLKKKRKEKAFQVTNNTGMDDIEFRVGFADDQDTFLSITVSGQALAPIQPPIHRLLDALYPTGKLPEQVSDYSHPQGPELKNMQSCTPFLHLFTAWCAVRHKDCTVVKCSLTEIVNVIIKQPLNCAATQSFLCCSSHQLQTHSYGLQWWNWSRKIKSKLPRAVHGGSQNSLKYNDSLSVFRSVSYLHALESCFLISLHMRVYQMAVKYVQRSKLPAADVECVRWHSGTLPSSPGA
jgi:hypothetical protein